jgi:hypothetical protein
MSERSAAQRPDVAAPGPPPSDGLCDELGLIPVFGPVRTDERGRVVMTEQERRARAAAAVRALKALERLPDDDPPGTTEAMMRGIDAGRPHRKLFEGMY